MTHRILITTLYGDASHSDLSYYCTKDFPEKTLYCDAFTPAEAGCKYILSAYPIDEIVVFGMDASYQAGEENPVVLRKADQTAPAEPGKESQYGIMKNRLKQFVDDVRTESVDQDGLLSREEKEETIDFLQNFFDTQVDPEGEKKRSRYFHYLMQDPTLHEKLGEALDAWLSKPEKERERYRAWISRYLYQELKATSKFEALDKNNDVRIRYFCVEESKILSFPSQMMQFFRGMEIDDGIADDVELYLCLQNDHVSGMFATINTMNLTKVLPSAQIHICRVITEAHQGHIPFCELQDKTEEYNISELLSATGAFLRYGKANHLLEYWKNANLENPKIDRILYAMRNIDSGISLCDIADLERGIKSLRSVIKNDLPIGGEKTIEEYFELVVESIRRDYGRLLEEDQISFIDLVRWAYRKGFCQQTLTLIESRAPQDFVEKGIFFYSDGERSRKHAIANLGQIYYDLKPFEKYKLDNISHYYIKYYSRRRAPRNKEGEAYQMGYAETRMEELDTHDENLIRALTICPDRAALRDLLFAYYHLSDVRNVTNHAREEFSGFYDIMADADPGERMKIITQAIDYFIHCYDQVANLIKGKKANVVTIKPSELADYAQTLRERNRRDRERSPEDEKTGNTLKNQE